jgi:hypothetical protein
MPRNDRLQETLSASFGIVTSVASSVAASVAEEVRKGPRAALKLPAMAMVTGAAVHQRVRQDLSTGVHLLRSRFNVDDVQEPFVSAFDRVTEDTRDLVDAASSALRRNGKTAPEHTERPEDEAPKAAPTPKRPRKSTPGPAASAEEASSAEQSGLVPPEADVPADVAAAAGTVLGHDDLPLPDFDHMTVGQLRGRLRSLDLVSLVQLRDYEEAHANRLQIVAMLNNRIAKVQAAGDDTGSPQTSAAGAATETATGSRVTPATAGPPVDPPSHGGLTNPAQPR